MMANQDENNLQACISSIEKLQNEPGTGMNKDCSNLLQSLHTVLNSGNEGEVNPTDADRIHKICLQCITDVDYIVYVLSILTELIHIHTTRYTLHVDFSPSALAIMKFLTTDCLVAENESDLRMWCLELLMKQPVETWILLIRDHTPVIIYTLELIFGKKAEDLPSIIQTFKVLLMLKRLPRYERILFVEGGFSLWLGSVIPMMIHVAVSASNVDDIEDCLVSTELLAEELVPLNYFRNPHRLELLKQITDPEQLPKQIMILLKKGMACWSRIIIVLIKILQNQLTEHCTVLMTSPLYAMLPILRSAFASQPAQIRRAFACWNELINSLCHENGMEMEKKIKLLMKPLTSDNTETEETVLVKFETWWHFIHKFEPKVQNFNEILIYFLHFMFGSDTKPFQAICVSDHLRNKCIDALAMLMNGDCFDCDIEHLEKLDSNITTTILLADHWKDFVYALKSCIKAAAQKYSEDTKRKIQCIWFSILTRLAAFSEDTSRQQDMFDYLINILPELLANDPGNEYIMEILVDDITLSLFRDKKLKTLTELRGQSQRLMPILVKFIMDDQFNIYFNRFNSEKLTELLQPLISTLLDMSISTPESMICLLDELQITRNTLTMWTALAQASEKANLSPEAYIKILRWPFKTVHSSLEVKEAADAWSTLYNSVKNLQPEPNFDSEIVKFLTKPFEDSKAYNYLMFSALIGVLKHNPYEEKLAKLLLAFTYEMNDYNELLIPLVNTIIELMIHSSPEENLANITMKCVENILKAINSDTEANGSERSCLRAVSDTITTNLKDYLKICPYQYLKKQVESLITIHDKTENPKKHNERPKKASKSRRKIPVSKLTSGETDSQENQSITPNTQKNRKPRIVKKIAIENQSAKKRTRKILMDGESGETKSKTQTDEPNKSKLKRTPKAKVNTPKSPARAAGMLLPALQTACSEDVIENSQDSTMTTNRTPELTPKPALELRVVLERITIPKPENLIQDCIEFIDKQIDLIENMDIKPIGDSENTTGLTENIDTEPLAANETVDVIIPSEALPTPFTVNSEAILSSPEHSIGALFQKQYSPEIFIDNENTENDSTGEQNTEENYLDLQRSLPTASSPSGPILKRNYQGEIFDDSTVPPAKKKRVSFHNPPVSNTVSVQKYIEPISPMCSPQTSATRRLTRSGVKSLKKLDNTLLASPLSENVEAITPRNETENISLDVTPAVEIVQTSELNGTDPICPDLTDCTDHIDVITIRAMRNLLIKEFLGKADTVGDLAKITELEINKLCIKAPKITVAKKVLLDYVTNKSAIAVETVIEETFSEPLVHVTKACVETQTDETEVSTKSTQFAIEVVEETFSEPLVHVTKACVETQTDETEVSTKSTQFAIEVVEETFSEPLVHVTKACVETQTDETEDSTKSTQFAIEVIKETFSELLVHVTKACVETQTDETEVSTKSTQFAIEVTEETFSEPLVHVTKACVETQTDETEVSTKSTQFAIEVVEETFSEPLVHVTKACVETQTDETEVSTKSTRFAVEVTPPETQTELLVPVNTSVQTGKSGCTTAEEILDSSISCMSEREDSIEKSKEKLNDDLEQLIAKSLSAGSLSEKKMFRLIMENTDVSSTKAVKRILKYECKAIPKSSKQSAELTFYKELLSETYQSDKLIPFCFAILQNHLSEPE